MWTAAKAVSRPVRLEILSLLKDPVANFPPQTDGDLVRDGVCADFIRDKLGIAAATASRQLTRLTAADLWVGIGEIEDRQESEVVARAARQLVHVADVLAVTAG